MAMCWYRSGRVLLDKCHFFSFDYVVWWFQVVWGVSRWFEVVLGDFRWFWVVSGGSRWFTRSLRPLFLTTDSSCPSMTIQSRTLWVICVAFTLLCGNFCFFSLVSTKVNRFIPSSFCFFSLMSSACSRLWNHWRCLSLSYYNVSHHPWERRPCRYYKQL